MDSYEEMRARVEARQAAKLEGLRVALIGRTITAVEHDSFTLDDGTVVYVGGGEGAGGGYGYLTLDEDDA